MKKPIGIVIAMESELRPYLDGSEKTVIVGGKTFYLTKTGQKDVVIVYSGIGKVNAAYACTLLCNHFEPEFIITTGLSGGLGRSNVLETVVATATCQHDSDTTALGDPIGLVSTVNKIYFPTDEKLTELVCKITGAKKGVFACGDQFVADKDKAERIVENFDAIACDMESGAIGQIAYLAGVPYVALRIISDGANEGAPISFAEVTEKASGILFQAVNSVLTQLS